MSGMSLCNLDNSQIYTPIYVPDLLQDNEADTRSPKQTILSANKTLFIDPKGRRIFSSWGKKDKTKRFHLAKSENINRKTCK